MQLWSCMPNKVVVESQRVSIKFKVILNDFSYNQAITLGKGGAQDDRCSKKDNLGRISVFFIIFFARRHYYSCPGHRA